MNVRSNMLLFFFLSFFFFSVCMYDLAYIMHNHVLFLLFFLFFSYIREVSCKGCFKCPTHVQVPVCAFTSMCVFVCVCVFGCVHCVMCMYGWSAALSIILKLSLHLWWVGPSRCCAALHCRPTTTTTARTLCAQLLTKADCSADAQRTAA